jgi:translocation and assembly module TamB
MGNTERLKLIKYILITALLIGVAIFVFRGPYISNALKKVILPELANMTGHNVVAQEIYLNIFPLFIEAKGLKIFDEEGNKVLTAERVKGYIELSGILRKELFLRRLSIKDPEIWTDKDKLNDIIGKVKEYLSKEDKKKIKVEVKVVDVKGGGFSFTDNTYNAIITGKGLKGEVLIDDTHQVKMHISELNSRIEDFPELRCEIDSTLFIKEDGIDIKKIAIKSFGSEVRTSGFYSSDGKADLKADVSLIVDSVKRILGLRQRGEGKVFAKGDIRFQAPGLENISLEDISVDIKIKGGFYIQTLMEILKVKDRVEGWVDVDGNIGGAISDLAGSGDVRLKNGNLFSVDVDELRCKISYNNGVMNFKDGKALLYNGYADAEASLRIPKVEHYTLKIKFSDVDSPAMFKLIGWEPGFLPGKVKGELYTSDMSFNPSGWFDYENKELGGDVIGRVKRIRGNYRMRDMVVSLSDTELGTDRSTLGINGTVDIPASMLNLDGRVETVDVTDLTYPYFNRLKGSGDFIGTIKGKFGDPVISGKLKIISALFDDYELENISGEFSYRKNLLDVKNLSARTRDEIQTIRGSIGFEEAKELFDLKKPDYELAVSLKGADLKKLTRIFYKELPLTGSIDSDFKIKGKGPTPEYFGAGVISSAEIYKFPLDSVSLDFSYNYKDFTIKKAVLRKGKSTAMLEGMVSRGEEFSFKAFSDRLFISDIIPLLDLHFTNGKYWGGRYWGNDLSLSLNAEGSGTFDNPVIKLNGKLSGGTFKGRPIGSGIINVSVNNKNVLLNAALFDEKLRINGKAYLNAIFPWSAEVDIQSGRYDFLLSGILKDIPEDLLVNLKGHAGLSGDKRNFHAAAVLSQVNFSLYGHSFSNDSDIKLKVENRNLSFPAFTMRSGNTSFKTHGNIELGKQYDISLEGSSALSPLKGFSKRISVLRGDSDFKLTVSGKWDNPQINGGINIANASLGLKGIHQRMSSIDGYLYFEGDRIMIQKLYGKFGGGDVDVSGSIYLKEFNVKRFYLNARMNNISTSVSNDFSINFNGNISYNGTLDSQSISGEVNLNRARYRERVEWKSWLLKARPKERPRAELTRIEKAKLNIKVLGSDNIVVDNNIARTTLKVDMVLRGMVGHPLLFGRVESKGGKVYFRNNEFQILNASADFADPNRINPVMEIVAQTIVRGYNIKLSLEGQLEHFNLSLISDPPLDETDILSLLTVGQIGKELKGLEGGIGAGEAAAFLTGKAQDVLEERLRNITGLDRVQVDPYVSKSTGTVGPRVTVSKRLLGEKLFVTYTTAVGSTEEQILRLEYILGKNVSLIGVRDEKGSVGGDIKFRFEFK